MQIAARGIPLPIGQFHDPESTPEHVSNSDNLIPPAPHQFTNGNTRS